MMHLAGGYVREDGDNDANGQRNKQVVVHTNE